jgi:hypothetical protein
MIRWIQCPNCLAIRYMIKPAHLPTVIILPTWFLKKMDGKIQFWEGIGRLEFDVV